MKSALFLFKRRAYFPVLSGVTRGHFGHNRLVSVAKRASGRPYRCSVRFAIGRLFGGAKQVQADQTRSKLTLEPR